MFVIEYLACLIKHMLGEFDCFILFYFYIKFTYSFES